MNQQESKFNAERCALNDLLSNPCPKSVCWRSRVIVGLDNVANLLGLKLIESEDANAPTQS